MLNRFFGGGDQEPFEPVDKNSRALEALKNTNLSCVIGFTDERDDDFRDEEIRKGYKKYEYQKLDDKGIKKMSDWVQKKIEKKEHKKALRSKDSLGSKELKKSSNDIIFLFDGTGANKETDKVNSNIGILSELFLLRYPNTKYYSGVGTRGTFFHRNEELITAATSCENIINRGYLDLCKIISKCKTDLQNTRIHFYGFSRGAFCAHSLANMIRVVGLPTKLATEKEINDSLRIYKENDPKKPIVLRNSFVHKRISFLGMFDCVSTIQKKNEYHQTQTNNIDKVVHFLALHERRLLFFPNRPEGETRTFKNLENVESRFFIGDHTDIAGGYDSQNLLSQITLQRMIEANTLLPIEHKLKEIDMNQKFVIHDCSKIWYFRIIDWWLGIGTSINRVILRDDILDESFFTLFNSKWFTKKDKRHLKHLLDWIEKKKESKLSEDGEMNKN